MNYSASMNRNPGELAAAIDEWWHGLASGLAHIAASLNPQTVPAAIERVLSSLACLLAAAGTLALILSFAESVDLTVDWTSTLVNLSLKIANWL